jgi:hypothetical protein
VAVAAVAAVPFSGRSGRGGEIDRVRDSRREGELLVDLDLCVPRDVLAFALEDLLVQPSAAGRFQPPVGLLSGVSRVGWRDRLRLIACTDSLADIVADLQQAAGTGYELLLRQVVDA